MGIRFKPNDQFDKGCKKMRLKKCKCYGFRGGNLGPMPKGRMIFLICGLIVAFFMLAVDTPLERCSFAGTSVKKFRYGEVDRDLYDIQFIGPNHGWMGGKGGWILRTEDGGKTWSKHDSGTTAGIFRFSFIDRRTGWAVGQWGEILATTDGGQTWTHQESPTKEHFFGVDFTDKLHGVAAGDWGKIVLTEDGGQNWIDVSLEEDIILYDVEFVDRNEGWIMSEMGYMFHTVDGGRTWEQQDIGRGKTFFGVSFDANGNGVAVGMEGVAAYTSDRGKTWKITRAAEPSLFSVILVNGRGVAVGDSAAVYETTDGGESWQMIDPPLYMKQNWLQCVERLSDDPDKYIIAGVRGSILFIEHSEIVLSGRK